MVAKYLEQYGLDKMGWKMMLDNARFRLGLCRYENKTISLSRHGLKYNEDGIIEMYVKHEVAHAIVGPGAPAHGSMWQTVVKSLGGDPSATVSVTIPAKYQAQCPDCEYVYYRQRKPAKFLYYCTACGKASDWKKGVLSWQLRTKDRCSNGG
jgi:predicted SprT family Zn-dependent metalloprotease